LLCAGSVLQVADHTRGGTSSPSGRLPAREGSPALWYCAKNTGDRRWRGRDPWYGKGALSSTQGNTKTPDNSHSTSTPLPITKPHPIHTGTARAGSRSRTHH